jgi:beta-glucanase (GH16 family)
MKRIEILLFCFFLVMPHMRLLAQPTVDGNWISTPFFKDNFDYPNRQFDQNFYDPKDKWLAYGVCLSSGVTKSSTNQIYQYDRCIFDDAAGVIKLNASWIQDTPIQCGTYAIPPDKNCDYNHHSLFYKSGMIETPPWRRFLYGYFEIRCKFPYHPGSFPAFWLWGADDSEQYYEEIDIAEYAYNDNIGEGSPNIFSTGFLYNKHSSSTPPAGFRHLIDLPSNNDITQWHTYGCERLPGRIIWYLDGEVVNDYCDVDSIPCHPLTIKVNYAIDYAALTNGIPAWKGTGTMAVDYVKVYKLKCDCSTDVTITNNTQLANFDQKVMHDITIGSSNGITVLTNTNVTMRACNSITITGPFEVPTGAQIGMMVHPCTEND